MVKVLVLKKGFMQKQLRHQHTRVKRSAVLHPQLSLLWQNQVSMEEAFKKI
jgi:hypothetical protein